MMTQKDIEEVKFMAKVWKMNDERNKRLAEEAEKERKRKALEWLESIR
jgi:hypothetical protein